MTWACGFMTLLAVAGFEQASISIRGSLEQSLTKAMPNDGRVLAAEIARLLRWQGDVTRQLHPGDRADMVFDRHDGVPALLALDFAGTQMHLQAYRFTGDDGIARFYDGAGALIEPRMANTPVPRYVQITETVQHGRGKRKHRGIDLKAPEGTPIILPYPGRVVRRDWFRRVNGHCIEMVYDSGQVARFLHLAQVEKTVQPGAYLSAGAPLGTVGSTGHSSAAHLHYEVWIDGVHKEPLDIHGRERVQLNGAALTAFLATKAMLQDALKTAKPALGSTPPLPNLNAQPVYNAAPSTPLSMVPGIAPGTPPGTAPSSPPSTPPLPNGPSPVRTSTPPYLIDGSPLLHGAP